MNRYMVMSYEEADYINYVLFDRQTRQSVYWTSSEESETAYQDICKMRDDFNRGGR